jgi:hypothetical protein
MPKYIKDTLLEGVRLFIFAIVGYLISGGEINSTILWSISLKIIDKLLHKYGKEEEVDWMITGLTRF